MKEMRRTYGVLTIILFMSAVGWAAPTIIEESEIDKEGTVYDDVKIIAAPTTIEEWENEEEILFDSRGFQHLENGFDIFGQEEDEDNEIDEDFDDDNLAIFYFQNPDPHTEKEHRLRRAADPDVGKYLKKGFKKLKNVFKKGKDKGVKKVKDWFD
jgi:hypothetical protein